MAGYHYRAVKAAQRSGGNLQDIILRTLREHNPANLIALENDDWFGGRLGSQSRGTELFSPWAARVRNDVGWSESPLVATVIETSWWGLVTGYLARIALTGWLLLRICRLQRDSGFTMPLFGFIVFIASTGPLDFQFPLACWFWLAVGMLLAHQTPVNGSKRDLHS